MSDKTPSPQSVVVPVEPTEAMLNAVMIGTDFLPSRLRKEAANIVWTSMLAAAPAPSSLAGGEVDAAVEHLTKRLNKPGAFHLGDEPHLRAILAALSPEAPAREGDDSETYEIGKRDGYEQAVQDIDLMTGGDGEFYVSTAGDDCPDVATMKARISDRFEALTPRHEAPAQPCKSCNGTGRELGSRFNRCLECWTEAPAEGAGEEDGAWIIHYEDRDREQEVFVGFGAREAAQRRYDQITVSWNAHLFERVKSALPIRARSSAPEAREGEPVGREFVKAITYNPLYGTVTEGEHPSKGMVYYPASAAPSADKLRIDLWWNAEDWETTFDNIEDAYEAATNERMRGVAALGRATQHDTVFAARIDIDTTGDGDADDYEIRLFATREEALAATPDALKGDAK